MYCLINTVNLNFKLFSIPFRTNKGATQMGNMSITFLGKQGCNPHGELQIWTGKDATQADNL